MASASMVLTMSMLVLFQPRPHLLHLLLSLLLLPFLLAAAGATAATTAHRGKSVGICPIQYTCRSVGLGA